MNSLWNAMRQVVYAWVVMLQVFWTTWQAVAQTLAEKGTIIWNQKNIKEAEELIELYFNRNLITEQWRDFIEVFLTTRWFYTDEGERPLLRAVRRYMEEVLFPRRVRPLK